ncbi:MAG: hypothetical protein EOP04_20645 [Proteobacteria bacterium]|nr:MAG: hypothetical protein EOP04_20645 [Pseudomonadota bacterium]
MKFFVLSFLTALTSFTAHADDSYSGLKILNYLPKGRIAGDNCLLDVSEWMNSVSVTIYQNGEHLRSFNNLLGTKEQVVENTLPHVYEASFVFVPNDSYTGLRRFGIKILSNAQGKTQVTVSEQGRVFGIWAGKKETSCVLR